MKNNIRWIAKDINEATGSQPDLIYPLPPGIPDDEVTQNVGPISAEDRIKFGKRLENEAAMYYLSAWGMNPSLKPPSPPKVIVNGSFMVRLSKSRINYLRGIAAKCGVPLRLLFELAIIKTAEELRAVEKVNRLTGLDFRAQEKKFKGLKFN